MNTNLKNINRAQNLSFKEKIVLALWRNLADPLLIFIGGQKLDKSNLSEHQYGDLTDEKLDFISTDSRNKTKMPFVHIHGGGWIFGSKGKFYGRPLSKLNQAGYPIFSINYPLAPEMPHPQALVSCLKALAWIKSSHPSYNRIYLSGDSAGGNLAMMLTLIISNPSLLREFSSLSQSEFPEIKTVIPIYAPLDRFSWIEDGFPSARTMLKSYAGIDALDHQKKLKLPVVPMDVATSEKLPPVFIVAGSKDKLARSSKIYADHLKRTNQRFEYKVYDGADHGFFCFGTGHDELINDLINYLKKTEET